MEQAGIARIGVSPAEDEVATIPIATSVRPITPPPIPDSDLLAAFAERNDRAALTAIVERYSALVYRVAMRSLNDRHMADDVFQATFLVLAQSARRIKDGDLLAAWLHGTTRNLARKALTFKHTQRHQLARQASLTRSQKGGEMSTPAELDPLDQLVRRHEQQLLDEELQNLPESSRAPLVLYYLEEKSQAEIAQLMGLTVEAVEGRLRRAKHDLRLRLIRRGVTLSGVVAAATLLTPSFAAAAPTPALISTTITAALGTAAGTSLAAASTTAATLATKEVAAMSLASKATAFVLGTAGVLTISAGLIFGAVVTSMGREGAEQKTAAAQVLAERSQESEEISTELALVDEVSAELAQAESPLVEQPSSGDKPKATVYQLSDLLLEQRDQIQEFVKSLGAESSWHRTTQSLVIRADSKTHEKIAEELSEMRKQVTEAEAEIQKLKVELSERQSVLAKDHPDVQELEDKIRQLQLSMEARDLLREKDNEILKWQKMYREEQIEKEMQRDQVARREKMNAQLVEKLNAATSNEAAPTTVDANLNWAEKMFSSLSHDFGDVAPGSVPQHVIRITNRYKERVTLTVPEQLCACGTVTLDKTVLQSREVALLTITVDTVKYRGQRVATISLNASFEPKNSKPVRIPVTANILRAGIGNGDARLTNVDRENGTVWLNIGEQQNVKPQITFSVYDKSQSGSVHTPETVKARIEVVEVRENSSIARIVEETDPIEVGDIVDSPAWNARKMEHFALSGIIDLNGDGVADNRDRTTLIKHLSHHGAVIDVEITSEGVREPADGQLTDQTKWLVVGDVPAHKASKQHLKLVEEARELGVRIVALQDFLTYMGWNPEYRVHLPSDSEEPLHLKYKRAQLSLATGQVRNLILENPVKNLIIPNPDVVSAATSTDSAGIVTLQIEGKLVGRAGVYLVLKNNQTHQINVKVKAEAEVPVVYSVADLTQEQRSDFLDFIRGETLSLVYQSETESFQVTATPADQSRVAAFLNKSRDDAKLIDSLKQSLDQDQWNQINQQLDKQFEMETQHMMMIFGSMTRDELESVLKGQGASLDRMRRQFRKNQILGNARRRESEGKSIATDLLDTNLTPATVSNQTQDQSPELVKILAEWKAKSAEVRDFSGSFKRIEFDTIFATETRSQGRLMFERPDSGRIEFGPADAAWLQKPGRVTQNEKPYKIVSGEARTWLSTGTSAYVLHMEDKTYDLFDIPPAFQGRYLDTLPPHSQFGMQPPPLDGSYKFELGQLHNPDGSKRDAGGQAMPKAIHIVAIFQAPQSDHALKPVKFLGLEWPAFQVPSDTLEYLLDPETYLPLNVRTLDPSGNKETVYTFDHSSMKINAGFGALHPNPFQQPNLNGWKLMHHGKDEPDPAQDPPVSATPQNKQVMLSICMFETSAATLDGLTNIHQGKRIPKEGFGKLLEEATKEAKVKRLMEPSLITQVGKPSVFQRGGEFAVPIDGDRTKKSNYRPFGNQFTLTPHRRSAEGLFVEISGELSNLNSGKNDGNKGADLPTVEGQIIRAFVTIPGSTHEAIVGPIWKANAASPDEEMVGTYLWIREDTVPPADLSAALQSPAIPAAPVTPQAAPPGTISRVISVGELKSTTPAEVAEALKLLVEPESWSGTQDIRPLGRSIVIRNSQAIVESCEKEIRSLIEQERAIGDEKSAKPLDASPRNEN